MKGIKFLMVIFLLQSAWVVRAGEGMWLPHLLAALNLDDMQSLGMKMSAEDIYSVNQGSLKDAVVHFGGFCTGEIISDKGLVLTNHHCGYGQIQSHSSLENNYLRDGFWAYDMTEELSNPGLFVRFIVRIEDVSEDAFAGVAEGMEESERQSAIDKNLAAIRERYPQKEHVNIDIKPFFKGNQYILIVTKDFPDVRLVGAPPESIGKYGHDTDNWVWPRHTGDFSLFRVYTGPDGEPAEYSPNNVPLVPKHSLPISLDGVEEGDFTLVFGFPGSTDEYLPGKAVDIIANEVNPVRISIRESAMKVMDAAMKSDEKIKIQYASKFARLTNYWKKWIGESMGLKKTDALGKKKKYEREYSKAIRQSDSLSDMYGDVLPDLIDLYEEMADYQVAQSVHSEAFSRNIEFIRLGGVVERAVSIYENNGAEVYSERLPRYKAYLQEQYDNLNWDVDFDVCRAMFSDYLKYMPDKFMDETVEFAMNQFVDDLEYSDGGSSVTMQPDLLMFLIDEPEQLKQALADDEIRAFVKLVEENYNEKVARPMAKMEQKRAALMRQYMKAQMMAFPERTFYPDANSTMRVTYGQVGGYEPRDGVYYKPVTYMEGVMEKYEPGDWEFDLPERLIRLYDRKAYGPYAEDGKMPVCFIGSNHTTGGNSGSPAIDAHGNLIGLNFDRVWEGTMSDLNYDPSICRNIMVDVRYILFIIDRYAEAQNIIDELNLVHPKE